MRERDFWTMVMGRRNEGKESVSLNLTAPERLALKSLWNAHKELIGTVAQQVQAIWLRALRYAKPDEVPALQAKIVALDEFFAVVERDIGAAVGTEVKNAVQGS